MLLQQILHTPGHEAEPLRLKQQKPFSQEEEWRLARSV